MHLECTGKGGPVVILEAPQTGLAATWIPVQEAVSRFTRVCSYDRAGFGWSEPGPLPRTSRQIAMELHALLANADFERSGPVPQHIFERYGIAHLKGEGKERLLHAVLVERALD